MDRSIFQNKMVAHPSFELLQKFLCLIFQGKGFCIKIQLALLNKPNLRSSPRETEPDSLGRGSGQHINLSQIFQSPVMKNRCHLFYGQSPSFISVCLKNSSQTIFLAHYYQIYLENSPQLNFRTMKRCHFFMDSVHFKNFWTLSADHFPLPAVFFHC